MMSQKQLAANRRNAQQSTGPRSVEGKARVSQNALKTGLYAQGIVIGSELGSSLEQVEAQFTAEYHPFTATERSLVDQLVHCEWMLRRFRWVETEVWKVGIKRLGGGEMSNYSPYGYAYTDTVAISRVYRQRAAIHKMHRETIAELRRLQSLDPQPTSPSNGFVPSTSPQPPDADPQPPK